MDPNAVAHHEAAEAEVLTLRPRGGHLSRARYRAGAAASKVADRIWGPVIDRHTEDANGFLPHEYGEAAERIRASAAAADPDCAVLAAVLTPAGPGRWVA